MFIAFGLWQDEQGKNVEVCFFCGFDSQELEDPGLGFGRQVAQNLKLVYNELSLDLNFRLHREDAFAFLEQQADRLKSLQKVEDSK
jgi:hypothetical protein